MTGKAVEELRNTARYNKRHLKGQSVIANIYNNSYALSISGIGKKSIRMSLFLSYDDLVKYQHHKKLENMVYTKINTIYPRLNNQGVWRAL